MRERRITAYPEAAQRLIRLLHDIQFGALENLRIEGGQPQFNPSPRIVRETKFGTTEPRPNVNQGEFVPKAEVVELLERLAALGDGVVHRIEIRHGLPFRMILLESVGA